MLNAEAPTELRQPRVVSNWRAGSHNDSVCVHQNQRLPLSALSAELRGVYQARFAGDAEDNMCVECNLEDFAPAAQNVHFQREAH